MLFSLLEDCSLGFLLFSFALGLLIFFCANRSRISYYISLHAMQLGVVVFFLFIERDKSSEILSYILGCHLSFPGLINVASVWAWIHIPRHGCR